MSECSHDCSSCSANCGSRTQEKTDFLEPLYRESKVKKVIGIVSGKGGVGKSMTTSLLGVAAMRKGLHTAILDADVTGPSIPQAFGLHERLLGNAEGIILPAMTNFGIEVVSLNLMLEEETQPVIWRGPVVADVVKQFWGKTLWKDIDVMFVDMPPGTGEVPLTVFQSIPLDGIVVVATPQELVGMIVEKAVNMANMMNVPVLGLIENMSYIKCPDCGKEIKVFGDSHIEEIAQKHNLKVLAKLPIDPKLAAACDKGMIELFDGDWLESLANILEQMEEKKMIKIAVASENEMVTEHFGHCINFNIFEAEDGQIVKEESIPNPGHKPGFLPNFLNDLGVRVIISGGMGGGAIDIFNEKGIEVIVGANGNAKEAAQAYLQGILKSTGSVCHEHQHHDECGK